MSNIVYQIWYENTEAREGHPFNRLREYQHIAFLTDTTIALVNFKEISKEEYDLWNQQ